MTHTQNQKHQLDNLGNISISQAPQAPKKGQNKPTTKDAANLTPALNAILPTLLANPTSTEVSMDTAGTTAAPKKKPQKEKAAEGTANAITGAASVESTQASSKRERNPSKIAQQVALQEVIDNNKKTAKKKKQVKKAALKAINKSPKETRAFLERARASLTSKPQNSTMLGSLHSAESTTDSSTKTANARERSGAPYGAPHTRGAWGAHILRSGARGAPCALQYLYGAPERSLEPNCSGRFPKNIGLKKKCTKSSQVADPTPNHGGQAPLSKRSAPNQLICAHQSPAGASVVSAASSLSSLTPSESVSQGNATPAALEVPASRSRLKTKKAKASTQPLLAVSNSLPPSRDASPFSEQFADGNLAEYHSDLGIDPAKLLNGIPAHLAPLLTMPEPLPGPLYIPERLVPLPDIDLSLFPAAERTKIKAKRQLKVKDLKPADNAVVSSAISRFGALIVAVCGFPDSQTAWLLACNANQWASKKHGRHLKLTKESEYLKLLYNRIPQMRAGFVGSRAKTNVALAYKLEIASSAAEIQGNMDKVKHLLKDANFTLTSLDGSGGMYEHGVFKEILKNSLFQSAEAAGVIHNDLFGTISIPCMALAATAVEEVLRSYKSGTHVDNRFNANEFMPVYFSHLATLAAIYNLDEAQNQLIDHLQETADELRKPYLNFIRSQTVRPIRPIIPQALIAARYRAIAAPNANPNPPKLRAKHPPSSLTQELVCNIKMKLGAPRSVSVSSAPDSEVVDAIYDASHANRNTGPEGSNSLLAQIVGSSDSEVQAMRAGALESNAAVNTMVVDPQDSDSSDGEPSQVTGTLGPSTDKEATLSGDDSEDSDGETDGEGAAGLVPTAQHLGDVTMKTDGGAGNSEDEDEDDEGAENEGEEEE